MKAKKETSLDVFERTLAELRAPKPKQVIYHNLRFNTSHGNRQGYDNFRPGGGYWKNLKENLEKLHKVSSTVNDTIVITALPSDIGGGTYPYLNFDIHYSGYDRVKLRAASGCCAVSLIDTACMAKSLSKVRRQAIFDISIILLKICGYKMAEYYSMDSPFHEFMNEKGTLMREFKSRESKKIENFTLDVKLSNVITNLKSKKKPVKKEPSPDQASGSITDTERGETLPTEAILDRRAIVDDLISELAAGDQDLL